MRIAIMGAGGVGGYYGARLAAAGEEVHFIARGPHLAAIRERGLVVESQHGDLLVHPANASDDPADIGPVDIVLFCTKLWDTESAGEAIRPLIGPDTAVISAQNGVEAEQVLGRVLGPEHVMGGVSFIFAQIVEPGRILHSGPAHQLVFGEMDGAVTPRAEAFLAACEAAGFETRLSESIQKDLWEKFVYLTALSGVTCATRSSIGPILAEPATRALFEAAITEAAAVGRALGAPLSDGVVAERMAMADGLPPGVKSSMLNDLERGSRLELPWLSGGVVRLGREAGVETPTHRFIEQALALHAMGRA
ncbi:MAG: 2-dehydropantoate 2-reductase [Rhodospirillaceae bacterium]|jgi:2-dehydropantoate 2-reductase|nr:2-dehydropantoate 2-reductase [Rhodospirillaceae bacterium]MBT6117457.1 2-dehydropantoate 2-reductase [Rhodospirillaceae bacterium]